jgi:hypothetical protein
LPQRCASVNPLLDCELAAAISRLLVGRRRLLSPYYLYCLVVALPPRINRDLSRGFRSTAAQLG